jgi:hypothetical protein
LPEIKEKAVEAFHRGSPYLIRKSRNPENHFRAKPQSAQRKACPS